MSAAHAILSRLNQSGVGLLWLRLGLWIAGVVLAVWLAVRLVIAIMAPDSLFVPVRSEVSPVRQVATDRDYDFSFNPFIAGDETDIVAPVDTGTDAPETTLNLQLKGLRAGENGSAFIRTPDGNEDNYYIDDDILSGVILRGVFPDYVLIDVNGQRQRLTTEDAKVARNAADQARRNRSLSTLRTVDAADLFSKVQIVPNLDRQLNRNGVILKPRSAGVDLSDFGFQDGDVITSVAGVSLTSGLPDVADIRRRIRPGQPVRVSLIRDGAPLTLTIGSPS